ncbi:MAG: hypothetical protein AAGH76_14805 [Pseudomonadota bacterium]
MSADAQNRGRKRHRSLFTSAALLLGLASGSLADDMPDASFLEYLGTWEDDGDEADWILVADEEALDEPQDDSSETHAARDDDEVNYER